MDEQTFTTSSIPDWADSKLSRELSVLRARGEGQELEYMREFPSQARELGKEIAAFASTNTGTILIGVSDDGDLVGMPDVVSTGDRDQLVRRIEGLCRGMVKPAITPVVHFAVEQQKCVLALVVPKGKQPIYYSNSIPYVRHITESRPAEPHEVIELVSTYLGFTAVPAANPLAVAVAGLAFPVAQVLVYADELSDRRVNPWFDQLRANFAGAAKYARDSACEAAIEEAGYADLVRRFSDAAEAVADYQLTMGGQAWRGFGAAVELAEGLAREIYDELISGLDTAEADLRSSIEDVRRWSRSVANLAQKLPRAYETGHLAKYQSELSNIGLSLLHALVLPLHNLSPATRARIRSAARTLHLFETRQLLGRRVESIEEVQESIEEAAAELMMAADDAEIELAKRI